jgi:lipopolysaccharide export LptBFGC system permease protein LptF
LCAKTPPGRRRGFCFARADLPFRRQHHETCDSKKAKKWRFKDTGQSEGMGATQMDKRIALALYVVVMAGVIVGLDLMFFKNRFWERLLVNVGIVLVFAAFYLRIWGYSR